MLQGKVSNSGALQEQEDDPMDWEILPDIAIDDAVHLKLRNPLRPGNFYRSWADAHPSFFRGSL